MRITESTQYRDALANLEQTQSSLVKYQQQLTSGKRLNAPSDDPQAAALDLGAYAELSTVNQYSNAGDAAKASLSVTDSALTDIVNQLIAAKTTVQSVQGSNVTAAQRQAAITALQGIKESLVSDLNTTFQGIYVFGGTSTTTAPFSIAGGTVSAYQGDASLLTVDVGNHVSIAVTVDGQSITQGSASSDVFASLDAAIAAIQGGDAAGLANSVTDLAGAFDRAVQAQTAVGSSLARLDTQSARLTDTKQALESQISSLEDVNLAEAITGLQNSQTAQQATVGALATIRQQKTLMDYLA